MGNMGKMGKMGKVLRGEVHGVGQCTACGLRAALSIASAKLRMCPDDEAYLCGLHASSVACVVRCMHQS